MKAKIHEKTISEGGREAKRTVLAVCDSELLGKVFEDGDFVLDLAKYRSFYDGEEVSEAEAERLIRNATSINLVGEKSIAAAKKALGIKASGARKIAGIPHLQIYYA